MLARPNSVIAVGDHDDRPDYDYSDGVILQVYELADGAQASAVIPSRTGDVTATFAVTREGRAITVEQQGAAHNWRVLLVNVTMQAAVDSGKATHTPQGLLVTPMGDASRLRIQLEEA